MENPKYKHTLREQVRFEDVDSFGVMHNIKYLHQLEWARIKYLEVAGYPIDAETFSKKNLLMVVRQEIDYQKPLKFFDYYKINTRTVKIGNSSITVDSLVTDDNGVPVANAKAVMVYINEDTMQPTDIPAETVKRIEEFEGQILKADK
jgi:acyl-CoA thioester hydrolase